MSEENVEIAGQLAQASDRRDLAAMTERFDPGRSEMERAVAGSGGASRNPNREQLTVLAA